MEQLCQKVKALKPNSAFLIYCGVPVLLLVLFLVVPQWSQSLTVTSEKETETMVVRLSGINLLKGEAVKKEFSHVMHEEAKIKGLGVALSVVYMLSLIGVAALGYTKKMANYKYAVVPVVLLFIMLAFGVDILDGGDTVCITGSPLGWIGFLIAVAWCLFAYMRGEESIEL